MKRCALRCGLRAGPPQSEHCQEIPGWGEYSQERNQHPDGRWAAPEEVSHVPRGTFSHFNTPFHVCQLQLFAFFKSCYQILALEVPLCYITIFVRVFSPSAQLSASCWETHWNAAPLSQTFIYFFYLLHAHSVCAWEVFIFELRDAFFSLLGYICFVCKQKDETEDVSTLNWAKLRLCNYFFFITALCCVLLCNVHKPWIFESLGSVVRLWCSIQQIPSSGMEPRGEAVSSEKLAAIEDEEVLNKMVSLPSFGYSRSASVVWSLQAQVKCGSSELRAVEGSAASDVPSNFLARLL